MDKKLYPLKIVPVNFHCKYQCRPFLNKTRNKLEFIFVLIIIKQKLLLTEFNLTSPNIKK